MAESSASKINRCISSSRKDRFSGGQTGLFRLFARISSITTAASALIWRFVIIIGIFKRKSVCISSLTVTLHIVSCHGTIYLFSGYCTKVLTHQPAKVRFSFTFSTKLPYL